MDQTTKYQEFQYKNVKCKCNKNFIHEKNMNHQKKEQLSCKESYKTITSEEKTKRKDHRNLRVASLNICRGLNSKSTQLLNVVMLIVCLISYPIHSHSHIIFVLQYSRRAERFLSSDYAMLHGWAIGKGTLPFLLFTFAPVNYKLKCWGIN